MCSSECERVSNLFQDLEQSSTESNFSKNTSTNMHHQRHSSNSSRTLCISLLCLVLFLSITSVDSATIVKRRAVSAENTSQEPDRVCQGSTPCGWAVYLPISRRVDYYMKNLCDCPEGKECLKAEDDLSVNAYVYRCKKKDKVQGAD